MFFAQIMHGGSDTPCSYVIGCPVTKLAVVVHPDSTLVDPCLRVLANAGLTLAWIFETGQVSLAPRDTRERFDGLLSGLGLAAHSIGPPPRNFPDVPHVRPVRAWTAAVEAPELVLQVGTRILEIGDSPETFRPGEGSPFQVVFARAEIPVGSLTFAIVPSAGSVAYKIGDRLLVGSSLRAGTGVVGDEGMPERLLDGDPDTLVYPDRIVDGVRVSTLGAERHRFDATRRAATRQASVTRRASASISPPPVELVEDPIEGLPDPRGFIDVEPTAAWSALGQLTTIDLRVVRDASDQIAGARFVAASKLSEVADLVPRDQPVLLVDENGQLTGQAALALVRAGFQHVYRLIGGMELWRDAGLPVRTCGSSLPTAADHF